LRKTLAVYILKIQEQEYLYSMSYRTYMHCAFPVIKPIILTCMYIYIYVTVNKNKMKQMLCETWLIKFMFMF
jgi:hypothetical protein